MCSGKILGVYIVQGPEYIIKIIFVAPQKLKQISLLLSYIPAEHNMNVISRDNDELKQTEALDFGQETISANYRMSVLGTCIWMTYQKYGAINSTDFYHLSNYLQKHFTMNISESIQTILTICECAVSIDLFNSFRSKVMYILLKTSLIYPVMHICIRNPSLSLTEVWANNDPGKSLLHDDVIKWKHFPRYWPFVRGIHLSPVNSPHKASDAELWCFLWSAPE